MCRGSCLSHVRWGRPRNTGYLLTTGRQKHAMTDPTVTSIFDKSSQNKSGFVLVCFDSSAAVTGWCGDKVWDLRLKQQRIWYIKQTVTQSRAQTNNLLRMILTVLHHVTAALLTDWDPLLMNCSFTWHFFVDKFGNTIHVPPTDSDNSKSQRHKDRWHF